MTIATLLLPWRLLCFVDAFGACSTESSSIHSGLQVHLHANYKPANFASYLHMLRDTVATTRRHVSDVAAVVLLLPGIMAVAALMLPP